MALDTMLLGKKEETLLLAKGFTTGRDAITGLYKLQKGSTIYYGERFNVGNYWYYNILLGIYKTH